MHLASLYIEKETAMYTQDNTKSPTTDAQRDYFRRGARGDGNGKHGSRGHDVGLRDEQPWGRVQY
jgi:hypothetical protein